LHLVLRGAGGAFNGSGVNPQMVFFCLVFFFLHLVLRGAGGAFNGSGVNPQMVFFVLLSFF